MADTNTTQVKLGYDGKLISEKSPFAINEAFRTLRTNMFYTAKGESCPVYGITSSFAHSGKSLIISNLAISFAQLNKKVLLIDCDLRNSVIHTIFGMDRGFGISELLAGSDNAVDKCLRKTTYPNLQIITAGGMPPNPTELLASERMSKFIEFLKEHFDVIFVDLPPIGVVTDASVIAEAITGYMYVVRAGLDDFRSLKHSLSIMEQLNANVIGFILNDVDSKAQSKYGKYGYGKYGRYGYGKYVKYGYGYGRYGKYGYGKYGYGYGYGPGHHDAGKQTKDKQTGV